jgi:predicted HTH transcriptional regulator
VQIQRPEVKSSVDQVSDQVKLSRLSENQLFVYLFIKEHDQDSDQVTTGYIAKKLGTSYSTVKRIITLLKSYDLVCRVGSDKKGYWKAK